MAFADFDNDGDMDFVRLPERASGSIPQ